jgi:L-threonylcarbamoyladenylate synthase
MSLKHFKKNILAPTFVFAYPTEAVYGLGCNPFDQTAVNRILSIKQRPASQRFILIASDWSQIENLIDLDKIHRINPKLLLPVKQSWPGPVTWVFPASDNAPEWLVDANQTIALRITAHPIASKLCKIAEIPLISTSANISGKTPCRSFDQTKEQLGSLVNDVIDGSVDLLSSPTPIRDVLTGEYFRG